MFILGVVLLLVSEAASDKQLKQVNIVFRHGDRTPTSTFPGDNNTADTWPQGFGQLTVKGMQQQFELGQFLRARYIESSGPLLSSSYNRSQVFVRSTDVDRTLMSVQCQLAGLFPPSGDQVWNSSMPWQPIPVHTQPVTSDYLLNAGVNCSKWNQLWQQDIDSGHIKRFFDRNRALLQWISSQSGVALSNPMDIVTRVTDPLNIERWNGRSLPRWANASVLSLLQQVEDRVFTAMFGDPEKSRLRGGFLLRTLLDSMDAADTMSTKLFLYSAHDTTVAALLSALQVFDTHSPSYASAVLVELWQEDSSPVVKVFYKRGVNDSDPQLLTVPGCSGSCPLALLRSLSRDYLPAKDFDDECENGSFDYSKVLLIAITVCAALVVVMFLGLMLCCVCQQRSTTYSRIAEA